MAAITGMRWRVQLHLLCWRRHHSAKIVRVFIQENACARGATAVMRFMTRVRRLQSLCRAWIEARRGRLQMLLMVWDDVESILRAELSALQRAAHALGGAGRYAPQAIPRRASGGGFLRRRSGTHSTP